MDRLRLSAPDFGEVGAGLERFEPDDQAEDHRVDGADDDGVAVDFEQEPVGLLYQARDRQGEGDEDEDGVDDCG